MSARATGSAPGGGRSLAVALAAVVVTVAVALVVTLVVLVLLDDGWSRVIWAAIGALLLWQLAPRPARPSAHVVALSDDDAPSLHRLVAEVADATSARRPDSVAVDTTYSTSLVPVGYLGRTTLVVGLPQWTALDGDERVAVLAHVLACADGRGGAAGILFRLADDLLTRLVLLLSPTGMVQPHETAREQSDSGMGALGAGDELAGERFRREVATSVGAAGMSVVAAPARALQRLLRRAAQPNSSRSCLAADRGAAAWWEHRPSSGCCSAHCRRRGPPWRPRWRRDGAPTRSRPCPTPSDPRPTSSRVDWRRPRATASGSARTTPRPRRGSRRCARATSS